MKNGFFLKLLLLFICNSSLFASTSIINSISVQIDTEVEGAKGMSITYKYNFLPLEEENHNDTLLNGSVFSLQTSIYQNSIAVEPAKGFSSVANENGAVQYTKTLMGNEVRASKIDKNITQFIPYAALNLQPGNNIIQIRTLLTGKDATGKLHEQTLEKSSISFNKPTTKNFVMNIDFIEINTLNSKGKAWDYSLFKTDAPDVGVTILVGNTVVWNNSVNDTYMFSVGPNSRNINFTISEKDKVVVLIQDIDIMFHDIVAKLLFSTNDKKLNTPYYYNKSKGNIKSCNLSFKIE